MKQKKLFLRFLILPLLFTSCIQDDVIFDTVEETVRITSSVDTLAVGDTYQFEARFTNNIGQTENRTVEWLSSNPSILSINELGEATGQQKGQVEVIASVNMDNIRLISDTTSVTVAEETVESGNNEKSGTIRTTSSYVLEGTFKITQEDEDLRIEIAGDYRASSSLPGLYLYLTNNPNTISNAKEIAAVQVFSGAHSYTVSDTDIEDYTYLLYYCKPFRVKVGDGKIE